MRKALLNPFFLILIGISFFSACSEIVDINAPSKDIWVVYGIMNPQEDYQYLRISKAFLPNEDAYDIARESDFSAKNLEVKLVGLGKEYQAVELDSVLKDISEGDFGPLTTLYRIETRQEDRLKEEAVYNLFITSKTDSNLSLQAYTRIPPKPQITYPISTTLQGRKCLPVVNFQDSVAVYFRKHRRETFSSAMRYELRVFLRYFDNGVQKFTNTKPTRLFYEDSGCNQVGNQALCYQFGKGNIITQLKAELNNPNRFYRYDDAPICGTPFTDLTESVEIQVTAVDTFLSSYILSNDPRYINLNTVRREFTNIEGNQDAVGVFGSIAYHNVAVALSSCAEYQLGLNPNWDATICD